MSVYKELDVERYTEENNDCYTNDYYGFLAGFSAQRKIIKDLIISLTNDKKDFTLLNNFVNKYLRFYTMDNTLEGERKNINFNLNEL